MKKWVLPVIVLIIALILVDQFTPLNIKNLFEGFGDFIGGILQGGKK